MLRKTFRAWGQLNWILDRLPGRTWSLFGCLATEERCTSAWWILNKYKYFKIRFIDVLAPDSRYKDRAIQLKLENRKIIDTIGKPAETYSEYDLHADASEIVDCIDAFILSAGSDVILDITCFPKRFFFPFVARIMDAPSVKNFLITYSVPKSYHQGTLAEDHKPLDYLPLFSPEEYPEPKIQLAIIGIGFMPLGVSELFQPDQREPKIKLLFPFPPGPPNFQRNWKFLTDFEKVLPLEAKPPIRVEAYNVSDVFDHIVELTELGQQKTAFAPYGPKPMSLAMCLFARKTHSPVVYTQPTLYHPEYSMGVTQLRSFPVCHAYCIKLDGSDLYSLPNVNPDL